jgi:hypothetical protein
MPDDLIRTSDSSAAIAPGQRRYPRYSFTAAVQAVDTAQRSVLNARISDLGRGGCYVDAFSPFPMKTGVKLRITCGQRAFEAHAQVVYSKTGMGMGLAFTTVEPEQMRILDRWLAELSGAAPMDVERGEESGEKHPTVRLNDEQCFALVERTISLIRQGNLTSEQGKTLLRNLLCRKPEA